AELLTGSSLGFAVKRRSANGVDEINGGDVRRPRNSPSPNPAKSRTAAAEAIHPLCVDLGGDTAISETTAGTVPFTGARKRYPRRATVSTKRGFSAVSPSASRSRRT